jgi:phosphatidylglycerophosphate synthase/putative flippase GtrA
VIPTFAEWVAGHLSPEARVITAIAPVALVGGYVVVGMIAFAIRNASRPPYHDADVERRGSTALVNMWLRRYFAWTMAPLSRLLVRLELPPNAVTSLSLLFATGSAVLLAKGRMALGGWLFVAAGLCDFLDGRLARHQRTAGPSGAVFDSVLDRYVESAIFIGLAWFYRDSWVLVAVMLALVGSLLVPYVRARGESLGVRFENVGVMQRPERVLILGLALALAPIVEVVVNPTDAKPIHRLAVFGILILAAATQVSALQRLRHAYRELENQPAHATPSLPSRGSVLRDALAHVVTTGSDFVLVAALVGFVKLPAAGATFLGCVAGGLINFSMNRAWAFASDSPNAAHAGRYVFVTATSALLNTGLVAVLLLLPDVPYQLAWILVRIVVYVTWNLPLHRDYVFQRSGNLSSPDPGQIGA